MNHQTIEKILCDKSHALKTKTKWYYLRKQNEKKMREIVVKIIKTNNFSKLIITMLQKILS